MSDNNIKFFSVTKNKKVISKLYEALENISLRDQKLEPLLKDLTFLISNILNNTDFYDTHCQSNINWIGESTLNESDKFTAEYSTNKIINENDHGIKNLYTSFYRFLSEANFSVDGTLTFELRNVLKNLDSFLDLLKTTKNSSSLMPDFLWLQMS